MVVRMKAAAEELADAMAQPGRKATADADLQQQMATMAEELEIAMEHQEEIHEVFLEVAERGSQLSVGSR